MLSFSLINLYVKSTGKQYANSKRGDTLFIEILPTLLFFSKNGAAN